MRRWEKEVENKPVIATELLKGQGLGNQLFCYVTVRCLALGKGYGFSILNRGILTSTLCGGREMCFMEPDCGLDLPREAFATIYHEKDERLYIGNSSHDIHHGCYVAGADGQLFEIQGSALIYGNMQAEAYFGNYKEEIRKWLKVKPEYDCMEYSKENLCIINIRGGEYSSNPELFLRRKYWLDAMDAMRRKRRDMEFLTITDDVGAARRVLPEIPAYHFALSKDYSIIKNARYLILSNSTFAFFPAYTSETVEYIIAPKYWARHNVSDGYWASEQNIYSDFHYMDRNGRLFTADECRRELAQYQLRSRKRQRVGKKLSGAGLLAANVRSRRILYQDWFVRALRSLQRRGMRLLRAKRV